MKAKLKIVAFSPIWANHENETWETTIAADPKYKSGNVHYFFYDGKEYFFDIKEARIPKDKMILAGWLDGNGKAGKIVFEIQ